MEGVTAWSLLANENLENLPVLSKENLDNLPVLSKEKLENLAVLSKEKLEILLGLDVERRSTRWAVGPSMEAAGRPSSGQGPVHAFQLGGISS